MNCSEGQELPPQMRFRWEHNGSVAVVYTVVFVLGMVGNSAMFLILFRNQWIKKRRVHSLLLHMTVSNLSTSLIYVPKEIIHNLTIAWLGGDILCRILKFFDVFGVALSAGILVCISLDRFYSILFPLYVINAKRSVQWMLSVAWGVALLSSIPQIYIFRTANHPCFRNFTQCVSADVIGLVPASFVYWFSLFNIVEVYFIPLIIIVFCYGSILIFISLKSGSMKAAELAPQPQRNLTKLAVLRGEGKETLAGGGGRRRASSLASFTHQHQHKGHSEAGNGLRRTGGTDSYEKAKHRTLKMTIVVVACFLFCWTPYTVAMFIHFLRVSSAERPISPLLSKFLYAFAVFNSAISPYLYGYFSFNIREECRQLVYLFCRAAPRCLFGSSSSLNNDSSFSRSARSPGANAAREREIRRRAMIRRESRAPSLGTSEPGGGTRLAAVEITSNKISVRFQQPPASSLGLGAENGRRAPRLSDAMKQKYASLGP